MIDIGGPVTVGLVLAVRMLRELIALRRYRLRRESIERLARDAAWGVRVVDQDADGAITTVTATGVGPALGELDQLEA